MATTADIRNGAVILHKSKRMKVIEFQNVQLFNTIMNEYRAKMSQY